MSASTLYSALLAGSPVLPAQVLRAAHAVATPAHLAVLAGRDDLPSDLAQVLSQERNPGVSAAFRARATRPGASTARVPETRASVLASALGSEWRTPAPEALHDAIAAYMAKPTATLARALWKRPASWFTPQQALALLLGAESWIDMSSPANLARMRELTARLGPQLAGQALASMTTPDAAAILLGFDVPVADVARCVRRILQAENNPDLWRAAIRAAFVHRDAAGREELLHLVLAAGPLRDERSTRLLEQAVAQRTGQGLRLWNMRPADPPALTGPDADLASASVASLQALACDLDPAVQMLVVDAAKRRSLSAAAQVMQHLLRNPTLGEYPLWAVLDYLASKGGEWEYALSHVFTVDMIALHPDRTRACRRWALLAPCDTLRRHGWAPFGGPDKAARLLHHWVEAYPKLYRDPLLAAAVSAGLTTSQLLAMRMPVLQELLLCKSAHLIAGRVAFVIAENLGQDADLWAAFSALAETFPGTLTELLEATTALTQPA